MVELNAFTLSEANLAAVTAAREAAERQYRTLCKAERVLYELANRPVPNKREARNTRAEPRRTDSAHST